MDNQERVLHEMDNQEISVQEMGDQENFVEEMGAQNMCWELPAENKPVEMWTPTERSEGSPGYGGFRASWVPAEENVAEIPCPGKSSEGSSRGSQRSFKPLPPLPIP